MNNIVVVDTFSRFFEQHGSRVAWTAEAVETAKRLSSEGKSATQIAVMMLAEHPGITRNAVIGKLHRLGCAGGGRQPNKDRAAAGPRTEYPRGASGTARKAPGPVNPDQDLRSRSAFSLRSTSPSPRVGLGIRVRSEKRACLIERDTSAPESKWISIVDLEATSCRWPRGKPGCDDFAYCGAQIESDQSYCPHHCGLAYPGTSASYAKSIERNLCLMKA